MRPMRSIVASLLILGTVTLLTPRAHADVRTDVESQLHSDTYRLSGFKIDELKEYGKCRATLALAKKKLKPTDKLRSSNFKLHPKAVQDGDDYVIAVADIPWICDEIDRVMARGTLVVALDEGAQKAAALAAKPAPDERVRIGEGAYYLEQSKTCAAAVAKEVASGATQIEWMSKTYVLADAATSCQALAAWGAYLNQSGEANFEKVAPRYRAVGVDGERLRLFVQYDNVSFRGKRCEIIDGVAPLAKAKYVYQWLENADDTHTIRKYTFSGNRYKISEKTYLTEAKAYKGCK